MFGRLGPLEIIVILAILLLLFGGRGKISAMMGDMAKGIKTFKKGMQDDDVAKPADAPGAAPGAPKPLEQANKPVTPEGTKTS